MAKKYKTNNPLELSEWLNVDVFIFPLGNIYGFYKYTHRNKQIYVNSDLDYRNKIIVCSHELGHAVLHPRENCPFLKAYTYFENRLELEANLFGTYLLIQTTNEDFMTYGQIINAFNVAEEIAAYKIM
ncbi:ImmA/IrrE family metallo-endopeptidase [Thermoanaerobacterium sp. R66]|uniref:ImmA/IrrE family metallo-endopeptidase n=1 Tax=Thermoanaerobacterium sp. R66 TaxID=2742479 RepID=UPI0023803DBD|nr:ImmA/IrrE family metallo-endopeptidase [Thermoanaerobacterium sp. R66]MDE4542297.1 ImmA/IrrE family metallo-endopeptidase [Thermoanaerobacterium sp. R66]